VQTCNCGCDPCKVGMMFYHDGGVFFNFVKAFELQVAVSKRVDGVIENMFLIMREC
jgi:hypothetical protein